MYSIYSILEQFWPPRATWSVESLPDLTGKVFLVTGASSGIGKACATALAKRGGKVYVACRSDESARQVTSGIKNASGAEVQALHLDLSSLPSVKKAAEMFLSQENELHVLFNNGGVMAPPDTVTPQGIDMTFATNVLGAYYLTLLLLPALLAGRRTSLDGTTRVVNTSSSTAELAGPLDYDSINGKTTRSASKQYAQSKLGVAVFARELARRYEDQGIVSTSFHPGSINTELFRTLSWPVRMIMRLLLYTPEQGALTMLYCGVAPETKDSNGKYFVPWARPGKSWQPQPCVEDDAVGKKLWEWLEGRVAQEMEK
ncbi:NAD(P)-binding protein [Auricularia subglabra TFB-10046 SS5]|nr:NAD(P)-binding protein [Auricularia subglabra TFB-10046 SS5]